MYRGATSYANAPPWFFASGEDLLMLMDGDTLIKLAPDTGATQWFATVSSAPLSVPGESIHLDEGRVYAAGSECLSCFNLQDGKAAWKEPLPAASGWLLRKGGPVLMAVPSRSENSESQAILFEAKTGARIQTLNVPPHVTDFVFRPEGSVVVAKEKLIGFGPLAFSSQAN